MTLNCKVLPFALVLAFCVFAKTTGANSSIDSLLAQTLIVKDKSVLANVYAELAWEYRRVNADSALHWANACIELSRETGNDSLLATGLSRKGFLLRGKGDPRAGLDLLLQGLLIREKGGWKADQARSHIDIGNTHFYLGELKQRAGSESEAKQHFNNAEAEYSLAIDISRELHDTVSLIKAYSGLGAQYFGLQEDRKALTNWMLGLSLAQSIGDRERIPRFQMNIAVVYQYLGGQMDSALIFLKNAQLQLRANGDLKAESSAWVNLAEIHRKSRSFTEAIECLAKADSLGRLLGDQKRLSEIQENLAIIYDSAGNAKQALFHQRAYQRLYQEVLNSESEKEMAHLQVKYQTEKKERQNAQLRTERTMLIQGLIGVGLLLLVGVLYFLYYRQRQLSTRLKDRERIHDLMRNQDQKLINAMLEGQERERQRISTDLHDRMGSILSALKLYFGDLSRQFSETDQNSHDRFEKTSKLLEKALTELRAISRNLVSGVLMDFGLIPALQELVRTINDGGSVSVKLLVFGLDDRLPSVLELALFRTAQELLTNALKHAQANTITLALHEKNQTLELRYEDDGRGFTWPMSESGKGLGLASIQKRADALNGTVTLDTAPGKGTRFVITLPIPQNDNKTN